MLLTGPADTNSPAQTTHGAIKIATMSFAFVEPRHGIAQQHSAITLATRHVASMGTETTTTMSAELKSA